ncbi:MAG TPA: pitrilysin family protein [Gemmatimonadaceae bacterium]|nr:pitrilysin family protein [Gemmatimonadaceae bacterium]
MTTTARPQAAPPKPFRFPAFSRARLDNGLEVIIAPFQRLPLATIRLIVEGGAAVDAPGQEGGAWLTAKSLAEGTKRFSAEDITAVIEALGGELDPETDWNDISISTTITNTAVPQAIALLGDILRAPVFPAEQIERNRGEQIAAREQARRDPRQHADDMFMRVVYHERARFALPEAGEIPAIAGFDNVTTREFHARHFAPSRACAIVAGAVDPDETLDHVRDALGEWEPRTTDARSAAVDEPAIAGGIHVVDRAGAPQTELRLGHVGIPRLHPDYYAAVVMNSVFGGLFNSRINLNLREKHGYTYGAFSAFDWRVQSGPFVISTAVQTDATDAAVRETLVEMDRMRETRISEDERSLAVNFLAGVFPIRYETSAAIAAGLAAMRVFGLPPNHFETYRDRILSVTADDVLNAAQRHLQPENLQILALGEGSTIEGLLAKLGRPVARLESR